MYDSPTSVDEKKFSAASPTTLNSGDVCIDIPQENCESGISIAKRDSWLLRWLRRIEDAQYSTDCHTLEDWPNGYPKLAGFLSSDPNFMIYRSFSYLHSRLLLHHQYEITNLERELEAQDKADFRNGYEDRLTCRETDDWEAKDENQTRPRHEILTDVRQKLLDYDEILIKARELVSFQRPSNRDYRSVRTWFNNTQPLVAKEAEFIRCKEDVVTLRNGRECAGFDGFVESLLQKLDCPLTRYLFCTRDLRLKTQDQYLFYYSPSRVDTLVGLIITSVIFVLLIAPVVAMYKLTSLGIHGSTFGAIGVLIVFTLLFSAAMSLLTRAKRHELFAASAAYCAVLVVFIGNFGNLSVN